MSYIKNYIDNNPEILNAPDDTDLGFEEFVQENEMISEYEKEIEGMEAINSQHDFVGSEMTLERAKKIFEEIELEEECFA